MAEELPALARETFDRVAHRRSDAAWLQDAWRRARVLFVSPKSATPVDGSGRLALHAADESPAGVPRRFLGLAGEVPYFTVTVEPDSDPAGTWLTLRDLGTVLDDLSAGLLATAIALEQWHQRHPRCPICGEPTDETDAGWTRTCAQDGSVHFPRTDPAVIMLVTDGADRALLGRGTQWPAGRFSTLAGFVEPGESLEAAVAREVYEEVGVRIEDIRYVASQPWPFPSSLMLGFTAVARAEETIRLDTAEMAEAAWFTREEIRSAAARADGAGVPDEGARLQFVSPKLSISRYLIDVWLDAPSADGGMTGVVEP